MTIYDEIREKRKILRGLYGGMMKLDDVMKELGYKSQVSARNAIQAMSIPTTQIGKMKRYDTDEVAKRLVQLRNL